MAGRFRRNTSAAIAQRAVVQPMAGKTPSAAPSATLRAIFSGVTPCSNNSRIGRAMRRWKNPSLISNIAARARGDSAQAPMIFSVFGESRNFAGMVMNNSPAFRKAIEDQREYSADVAFLPGQVPVSKNEGRVRAKESNFEAGEF